MTSKTTAVKDPMTKTQLYKEISENTGVAKKDVQAVFDELSNVIDRHVRKRGAGVPYHSSRWRAVQRSVRSRWHWLQAFGRPVRTLAVAVGLSMVWLRMAFMSP